MNYFCLQPGSRFKGAPRRHATKTSLECIHVSHGTEGFNGVVALTIDG